MQNHSGQWVLLPTMISGAHVNQQMLWLWGLQTWGQEGTMVTCHSIRDIYNSTEGPTWSIRTFVCLRKRRAEEHLDHQLRAAATKS
mmetsp:Transcript_66404/g.137774  ORF Transcript_66404/g.137774 Transcript_66404/m.137774 type:complete len:86 (-) Transcript_66404:94-351(-)